MRLGVVRSFKKRKRKENNIASLLDGLEEGWENKMDSIIAALHLLASEKRKCKTISNECSKILVVPDGTTAAANIFEQ